jgi:hypothetical protein
LIGLLPSREKSLLNRHQNAASSTDQQGQQQRKATHTDWNFVQGREVTEMQQKEMRNLLKSKGVKL